MNGWARFALFALLLFPLAWLGLDRWHALLVPAVSWGVGALGIPFEVQTLDLLAPYDLAFFVAMVLATTRAPRAERALALLVGVPALVAAEVAFATLATWMFLRGEMGHPLPAALLGVRNGVAASFPWVAPPLAWAALLGRHAGALAGVPGPAAPGGKRAWRAKE